MNPRISLILSSILIVFGVGISSWMSQSLENSPDFTTNQSPNVEPIPILNGDLSTLDDLSASSILVKDLNTQAILYDKSSTDAFPIASLTKLMTAYLVFQEGNLSDLVTVSEYAASIEGSTMNLEPGEVFTVEELLYGMLIPSGNDAATALAEYVSGSEADFVNLMNQNAEALGMTNTQFANPSGLDDPNSYSSARDLSVLTIELLKYPLFREIVQNKWAAVKSENGDLHILRNTNILLGSIGVIGIKTGTTELAGQCLITLSRDEQGHELLLIILGSSNRYPETEQLVPWGYDSFDW